METVVRLLHVFQHDPSMNASDGGSNYAPKAHQLLPKTTGLLVKTVSPPCQLFAASARLPSGGPGEQHLPACIGRSLRSSGGSPAPKQL